LFKHQGVVKCSHVILCTHSLTPLLLRR